MMGEAEDGRDACHVPSEGERILIKDAMLGLLSNAEWDAAWGELIEQRVAERTRGMTTVPAGYCAECLQGGELTPGRECHAHGVKGLDE